VKKRRSRKPANIRKKSASIYEIKLTRIGGQSKKIRIEAKTKEDAMVELAECFGGILIHSIRRRGAK